MSTQSANEASYALSYLTLRKLIGILAITFPFVLSFGALLLFQTGLQSSVSDYYHTGMQDVFVGTLFAIAVFFLTYKGHDKRDDLAGDLACFFAIGLALFPTTPDGASAGEAGLTGYIHLTFAALFFLTLMYFSLFLFTKTDPLKTPSIQKLRRNRVYKICGYIMGLCLLLIALSFILRETVPSLEAYRPVYWLEVLAILAFGTSWLTKGEAMLKDRAKN